MSLGAHPDSSFFRCLSLGLTFESCKELGVRQCSFSCLSCGDVIYGTSYLYSLSCPSCGDVIYGTSYLYSLGCPSCGHGIYGTFVFYLATCTTIGTTDCSTLPLIIFYALPFMLSCSLFILELEAPPFSTLFFVLKTFLGESVIASFLFSNVV